MIFEKYQESYQGMPPLQINGEIFPVYSYIVFPFKKSGAIVDFFIRAWKQNKVISNKLRQYFISEMIQCTQVFHNLKIAHLDIKPDNFIINDDCSISFI